MPFFNKNAWNKKVLFSPHISKSTLRNRLALRKMLVFHKNIKIFVKKCLEKKVVFSTHKSKSIWQNCLTLHEMPFFSQKHKNYCQKTLGRKKLRFHPTSLNPLHEIV
jgi:hypothetical protein